MMQEFLEAEITNFLGRDHYQRQKEGPHRGYRNGYEPSRFRTVEGEVPLEVPQVRDTYQPFSSKLRDSSRGKHRLSGEDSRLDVCSRALYQGHRGGLS